MPVYSVLRTCQVRAGFDLSSERRGVLQAGQQVDALEQRENEKGVVRVRIERGWCSVKTKGGVAVLELVEAQGADEPSGSALPDDLKDESARGEPYIAPPVQRSVRAIVAVDVGAEPTSDAKLAASFEAGDVADVQDSRTIAGSHWLLLKSAAGATGWASELQPDGSARFEALLPIPMESWAVEWADIPEAPFAPLGDEPRDPAFYVLPRPGPEDVTLEGGEEAEEREFDMDDADLNEDGVWLFAEATSVAEVTFPPKTLFLLDMLRSPGHNRDEDTVRARRRALSAWLQAVHRLLPEDESVRQFFAPPDDKGIVTRFFQFGRPIARSGGGSEYVVYTIKCTADGGRDWIVQKRFSEFSQLRDILLRQEGLEGEESEGEDEAHALSPSRANAEADLRLSAHQSNDGLKDVDSSGANSTPLRQVRAPGPSQSVFTASKRVVMGAVVRETCEMDSPRCGVVRKGSDIVVLEERTTDDGVLRVRFDGGWVSATASNGQTILEPVDPQPRTGDPISLASSSANNKDSREGARGGAGGDGSSSISSGPAAVQENDKDRTEHNSGTAGVTKAGSVACVTVSVDSAGDSDSGSGGKDAPTRYCIRCTPATDRPEESPIDDDDESKHKREKQVVPTSTGGSGPGLPTPWEVSKRFSDVDQLRALLIETTESLADRAAVTKLPFPSKIQLNNLFKRSEEIIEDRRCLLELWLNGVLSICGGNEDLEDFLAPHQSPGEPGSSAAGNTTTGEDDKDEDSRKHDVDIDADADADAEKIQGATFRCVVRSVVREQFAVDSRRCGVLEVDQTIRALAGRRNAKGVLRIKFLYDGANSGWVSETDGSEDGTVLLRAQGHQQPLDTTANATAKATSGGAEASSSRGQRPPARRRLVRTYRCLLSTIATTGPLLDTAKCADVRAGELVRASEAMRDRDGNRRLKCEGAWGRGWVSETNPVTKQMLLALVTATATAVPAGATGGKEISAQAQQVGDAGGEGEGEGEGVCAPETQGQGQVQEPSGVPIRVDTGLPVGADAAQNKTTTTTTTTTTQKRRYRSLLRGVVRKGSAVDSEKVAGTVMAKNRVIEALEELTLPSGQVRVRFENGWVSVSDSSGRPILALLDEDSHDDHEE